MITLGTTSVEEQICAPIIRKWGISKENVNYLKTCNDDTINNNNNNTTYGMCKFHASGREDMDVRMILRPSSSSSSSSSIGRPFCVQLIDALRPVISDEELQDIVHEINHTDPRSSNDTADDDNSITPRDAQLVPSSPLWYGHNPMGVGISNKFQIVPALTFSNLQADTETKVKHYGCHCWSERELPPDWTFTLPLHNNNNNNNQYSLPLTIQQQTPLRVLHRRSNLIRERLIFEVHATRIDAHHFRLELSTQAGTYVKEFVHGDLGRTKPNMASLLQTKTNILLLDCEGIEMDSSSTIVPVEGEGGEKTSNDAVL
jgi:tRNA pseudouridine synthase 10